MFDLLPMDARHHVVERVRCFFFDHGHGLAMAASVLGDAAAEQRVIDCALRVEMARRLDRRIFRDLEAIHRLLSLEHVGYPDRIETSLFAELHPASAAVGAICRLTDQLADLLRSIDAVGSGAAAGGDSIAAL